MPVQVTSSAVSEAHIIFLCYYEGAEYDWNRSGSLSDYVSTVSLLLLSAGRSRSSTRRSTRSARPPAAPHHAGRLSAAVSPTGSAWPIGCERARRAASSVSTAVSSTTSCRRCRRCSTTRYAVTSHYRGPAHTSSAF